MVQSETKQTVQAFQKEHTFKTILYIIIMLIIVVIIDLGLQIGMNGMWLLGLPKADDIASVTISYPALTDEEKEITDKEKIEVCLDMNSLLRYRLFAAAEEDSEPLVTFCYHMNNGKELVIAANEGSVFYNGREHQLKDEGTFITFAEGLFFSDESTNTDNK